MEFLKHIPTVVIHREKDKEREVFLQEFETKMGLELQRIEAIDGETFCKENEIPRKHPREGETSVGNIGCTVSHLGICETFLETEHEYVCIFEDDIELNCEPTDIYEYIEYSWALPEWDMLFLGTNEIVEGEPLEEIPLISRVKRFWGTHAVLLTRKAARAILDEFHQSVASGYALPADWLYSFTILHKNLIAYCPSDPLACVKQKEGLVSTCTGNLRRYSK
jgi:GR25 family glycosyltransferase involved in LPS biosynthesis